MSGVDILFCICNSCAEAQSTSELTRFSCIFPINEDVNLLNTMSDSGFQCYCDERNEQHGAELFPHSAVCEEDGNPLFGEGIVFSTSCSGRYLSCLYM